jgi:outer membrane lipoprotein-sorting protein
MWHNFLAQEAPMFTVQRLVFVAVSLAIQVCSAMAAPIGLPQVIAALENPFKPDQSTGLPALETVTANFFQKSTIADKNKEIRADGEVFIRFATAHSPLMFRFDYFRPTRHEIISDGQLLWTYLPENKQAIRSDLTGVFPTAGFNPSRDRAVNFLQGLGRLSKDFSINYSQQGMYDMAGNYVLELRPGRAMATIQRLLVVVRKEAVYTKADPVKNPARLEYAFPILSTTVYDHNGNSTTMEFSNIRANDMLVDSLFSFTPPGYVQIVQPPANSR